MRHPRSCGGRHEARPADHHHRGDRGRVPYGRGRDVVGRFCGPSPRKDFRKSSGGRAVTAPRTPSLSATACLVVTSPAGLPVGAFSSHTAARWSFPQRRTPPRSDLNRRPGCTRFGAARFLPDAAPHLARAGSARPARASSLRGTARPLTPEPYRRGVAGRRMCSSSSRMEPGAALAAAVPGEGVA
jgi:hypothetical protein